MKTFFIATALVMIGASAHAGTYHVEGVTIHVQDGCQSSSCVSVYAPGYGHYHGGSTTRVHKAHNDTSRVAAVTKKDDAIVAPATATPAPDTATAPTPDKAPQAAVQATPVEPPAK
jgi:hypothetical protein